ncbi:hypothetical protein [Burkholderia sp. BCC1993]|uniref:hypothetical protein n=1 Tax=Burkholderia sp. BCC1993 TaxID=2817444 RepID=UPI002AAFE8AB|nr:hypothetical protein [Burkholderia sp. BCC1993]
MKNGRSLAGETERRTGVEAALKRRRSAAGAVRGEAGLIAEASSHYFTKITISFRECSKRQHMEGLAGAIRHLALVRANAIVSRLI